MCKGRREYKKEKKEKIEFKGKSQSIKSSQLGNNSSCMNNKFNHPDNYWKTLALDELNKRRDFEKSREDLLQNISPNQEIYDIEPVS